MDRRPIYLAALLAAWFVVVTTCAVVFVVLLEDVLHPDRGVTIDQRIMRFVVDHRTAPLTSFFRAATHLADTATVVVVVTVVAVALLLARRPTMAVFVVVATAGAALSTAVVKVLVGRDRPPLVDRLASAHGAAFPSGHSTQAIALYGALALVVIALTRSRAVAVAAVVIGGIVAMLVGFSRIYLGVHWPSDVIGGFVVGLAWLTTAATLIVARALRHETSDAR